MKPSIDATSFGSITVSGEQYEKDIMIHLNGEVTKRKKKLSKATYGTSHIVSLDEAEYIYEKGAELLIIGSGQYGALKLSNEASEFFRQKGFTVKLLPTPQAMAAWNSAKGSVIAMFHITC
ncbi:MAG: Mth938-like domain-containing protein [Calditrichaceae bacterium]